MLTNPTKHEKPPRLNWDRLGQAQRLDLRADLELSGGRAAQAERLAHLAAELRGVAA